MAQRDKNSNAPVMGTPKSTYTSGIQKMLSKDNARPYTSLKLQASQSRDTARVIKELDEIKELNALMNSESSNEAPFPPNHPGKVMRISPRAKEYNWTELRKHWVLGKRILLDDGSYASEDYTYKEFCGKFNIKYNTLKSHIYQQKWHHLRKAYLSRVNEKNIGLELGMYVQENYQAEIAGMNACNKLGVVLDRYIEHKFGDILDASEDVENPNRLSDEVAEQMSTVNYKTGTPNFLTEIKEAVNVATNIYKLQRQIYENAPKDEAEVFEQITKKPKFKSMQERNATIKRLEAKIGRKLNGAEALQLQQSANEALNERVLQNNREANRTKVYEVEVVEDSLNYDNIEPVM